MQNHHYVYGRFPARARVKDGKPLLSWRVSILPFIEGDALYKQFHLDEPWDSEHNRTLIAKMPQVYVNPVLDAKLAQAGMTDYLAVAGPNTLFDREEGTKIQEIKDGTSNTVMVVEANADRAVIWTKPDDFEVDAENPVGGLESIQPGGFMAMFADGHVQFIKNTIDPKVLLNLFNPRDGQLPPDLD
jgi:prepilin-type processing-associated H-X9-DG protein